MTKFCHVNEPYSWASLTFITKKKKALIEIKFIEKTGLRLNIQKTKIMASGPISSRQIDGETMETVTDFILEGSKSLQMVITAIKLKDACSLEGKL